MMVEANKDSRMIPAVRPAAIARAKLGESLGQIQEIPKPPDDVQEIIGLIARALKALFDVQSSAPEDPIHVSGVRQSMSFLSECLERLQDVSVRGPELDAATTTLAKTLAILYPISRVQERGPLVVDTGPLKPLPHDSRRATQRMAVEVDVGFESESQFYTGFTQDISHGGLFVATYDLKEIGTEIAISFNLPEGHLVSCLGVVRWTRIFNPTTPDVYPGLGVQFRDLTDEDRQAIETYLRERPAMFWVD